MPLQYQPVTTANARTQFNQTIHRKPILNPNQLIRRPDLLRFRDFVTQNSALHTFVDLSRKPTPYTVEPNDLHTLHESGFRWIVAHRRIAEDTVSLAGEMVHADLLPVEAWQLLRELFREPVIDNEESVIFDVQNGLNLQAPIHIDGENTLDLNLIFDPVKTGFPLILFPGQTVEAYTGTLSRFTAWMHLQTDGGTVTLRIEDGGIVREVPLALEAGHWQYIDFPIESVEPVQLHIVGRGDAAVRLNITQAKVVQ